MKRLFQVCNKDSSKPVEDKYFDKKADAKAFRDTLMGDLLKQEFASPKERCQVWHHQNAFKVTHGPDHWSK